MIVYNRNGYSIYRIQTRRCACYIINSGKYHVLVDTSMKFERASILKCIREIGIQKIDAIFLTHSHTDHVGNARFFSDMFQCNAYISEKGLSSLQNGNCTMPKGTNPYTKLINWFEPKIPFYHFSQFQACPNAKVLNHEIVKTFLGDHFLLCETPGHTEDSLSIEVDHKVAIVGDAVVNIMGRKYPPFADDEVGVKHSWKKLLDTQCEWFLPAHGHTIHRGALIKAYKKL